MPMDESLYPSNWLEVGDCVQFCPNGKQTQLFGTVLGFLESEPRAIVRWRYPYALVVAQPLIKFLNRVEVNPYAHE